MHLRVIGVVNAVLFLSRTQGNPRRTNGRITGSYQLSASPAVMKNSVQKPVTSLKSVRPSLR